MQRQHDMPEQRGTTCLGVVTYLRKRSLYTSRCADVCHNSIRTPNRLPCSLVMKAMLAGKICATWSATLASTWPQQLGGMPQCSQTCASVSALLPPNASTRCIAITFAP
jgi:hypothetical protein